MWLTGIVHLVADVLSLQEEAFSIWDEWASFYAPQSKERSLLEDVRDERWLISLVHHDFLDPSALWTFMFKGEKPLL